MIKCSHEYSRKRKVMDNVNGLALLEWCDKEEGLIIANESRKSSQKEVVREDGQICILDCDKDVPR